MDQLEIHLFGSFQINYGGRSLKGFESNKVRALLAYLVVEAAHPHQRSKLAGWLWPEFPESTALSNLRHALSNLRQVIGDRSAQPAYLLINPHTIQFNQASIYSSDSNAFEVYCCLAQKNPLDFICLNTVAELFQGSFLEDFSLPDSNEYEEWLLTKREYFNRLAYQVFHILANEAELSGEYQRAISFATRQLKLDPWREEAHRRLMRCLYYTGQRSAALAQYHACCKALMAELSLEPEQGTQKLYELIREDKLTIPPLPPSFMRHSTSQQMDRSRFVQRHEPLKRLQLSLTKALCGEGQLILVCGSPGTGKTALVKEFIRQSLQTHPALAAAWGNGRAYFGTGDPYLPFREILEMLTGQVEDRWEAGSISQEHALRMAHLALYSLKALIHEGPALIGTFIPGQVLLHRISMFSKDEPVLSQHVIRLVEHPPESLPNTEDLLRQYRSVLAAITNQIPLILFVDDLQWADQSSLSMLFHLSRTLEGLRILIISAFRPITATPSSDTGLPSLKAMINEFSLLHGDILINLDNLEERSFIDAYIDQEANRLDESFRQELFRYTHGHPLFTVEMLYGMQERGDLVKNPQGEWVVTPSLSWENLPARIEAVIAERLMQLPTHLQNLLKVASVEGEYFTGEVLVKVQDADEQQILAQISSELDQQYNMVQAESTQRVNGTRISRYRFRHILFQRYLYAQLELVERAHLHELVGNTLEEHYGSFVDEIAVQLAVHFELAGCSWKAIHYLHIAGQQAAKLSSFEDAIMLLNKALFMLKSQTFSPENDRFELMLLISLIVPLELERGPAAPELAKVCNRLVQLMNVIPPKPEMLPIIIALGSYYAMHAEYQKVFAIIPLGIQLAESFGDEFYNQFWDYGKGYVKMWLGEIKDALPHFEHMIAFYNPVKHRELVHIIGTDIGIDSLIWSSWNLWLLGYPEKAFARCQEAINLGFTIGDQDCQVMALELTIFLHLFIKDLAGIDELIRTCAALLEMHPLPLQSAEFEFAKGYYQVLCGEAENGLGTMEKGIETYQAIGTRNALSMHMTLLAESYLHYNQLEQATQLLQQAMDFIEETGERFFQAETLRVKGELMLHQSYEQAKEAEACFCQALQIAHEQEAKSLELRAAISLAQLLRSQGRATEIREVVEDVYSWFTEGFDTPDLINARALLDELGNAA